MANQLRSLGIEPRYEAATVYFTKPAKPSRYTPDFVLPNGVVIETKGRFVTADRQKHLAIKAAHPDLDIRFVFSNPRARIGKASATTYAMWCERYGFQWAHGLIPTAWLNEPKSAARTAACEAALQWRRG